MAQLRQLSSIISVSFLCVISAFSSKAQEGSVSIGLPVPDASAILDIQPPSGNAGLLIPRVNKGSIVGPAEGLMIYETADQDFLFYNDTWKPIGTPRGAIIMWSGSTVPGGWELCDGDNGTPDLSDRFVIGHDPTDVFIFLNLEIPGKDAVIGNVGGENLVALNTNQTGITAHNHSINHGHGITDPGHYHSVDNMGNEDVADANKQAAYNRNANNFLQTNNKTTGVTINNFNGNTAANQAEPSVTSHENRPAYYVLAYIQRQ